MCIRFGLLTVGFILLCVPARADEWGMFRGSAASGIAAENGFPTAWGDGTNVKWKVKLPAPANGSPIVSNGRVFVTSACRRRSEAQSDLFRPG